LGDDMGKIGSLSKMPISVEGIVHPTGR
jgi:hypothetical protein